MRKTIIFFCMFLFVLSCKKNRDNMIDISGNVKNAINNQSVAGVQVVLEVKELGGNSFSNTFTEIGSNSTDALGNYGFSFENRNAIEYRLKFSSDNYFSKITSINPDDLDLVDANVYDESIYSWSYLKVNISNTFPFNAADQITLNFNNMVVDNPGPGSCLTNIISVK